MRIDLATLESFRNENQVKSLALAMAIKTKFTNSIVYNWSYVRLAALFGLDRRTVKKYITQLQEQGLVETGEHLKIQRLYTNAYYHVGINIKYLKGKSIIEISNYLYFILLKQNARTQMNVAQTKRELLKINKVRSKKQYDRLRKKAKRFGYFYKDFISFDNELADMPVRYIPNKNVNISMIKMSRLFNTSIPKAYDILKFLLQDNLIRYKNNVKFIKKLTSKHEMRFYTLHPYYFITKSLSLYSLNPNHYWIMGVNM